MNKKLLGVIKKKGRRKKRLKSDALFKIVMTEVLAAKEFLEEYLPVALQEKLDLSTIKVEKESFVEPHLKRRLSDVVYSIKTKEGEDAFCYCLLEHQSSDDHFIALRLAKYSLLLCERHAKNKDKLPLIIPFVIYAGKDKYTAPKNLPDLFEDPEIAKQMLSGDYFLIDLQNMPDNEIIRKKHISLFEYTLKNIHQRDVLQMWRDIFSLLSHAVTLDKSHEYFYIKKLLWYSDDRMEEDDYPGFNKMIIDNLPEDGEEVMRTAADAFFERGIEYGFQEGREEGIQEGRQEGLQEAKLESAINMLKMNAGIDFISKATGLREEEILRLAKTTLPTS